MARNAFCVVHECIDGESCDTFNNYFELMNHKKVTRNKKL